MAAPVKPAMGLRRGHRRARRSLRDRAAAALALAVLLAAASDGCAPGARKRPADTSPSSRGEAGTASATAPGAGGIDLAPDRVGIRPPLHQIWRQKTGRSPAGDPVLSGSTIVVAASDRQVRRVVLEDGEVRWRRKTKGTPVVSPVVGGDRVYVAMSVPRTGVTALALDDGEEIWRRVDLEVLGPPLSRGDTLFVRAGGKLLALDAADGSTLWRSTQRGRWPAPMAAVAGALVLADETDSVRAVSRSDGAPLWTFALAGGARGTPVASGNAVYVAGLEGTIVALSAQEGREIWRTALGCRVHGGVAVSEDAIYVAGLDGKLYALDPESGAVEWRAEVGGAVQGSPVTAGDVVVVCTMAGTCELVSVEERRVIHTLDLEKPVRTSAVVRGGRLFVVDEEGNARAYESS